MGTCEAIGGTFRGHEWEISMPLMGRFEDINGKLRGHHRENRCH